MRPPTPPAITVQPSTVSGPPDPQSYARSTSQPPNSRKSVQFAESPLEREFTAESELSTPDVRRHRRRSSRASDAVEDTTSTPDGQRRRSQPNGPGDPSLSADQGARRKRHHTRQKSHDPSISSNPEANGVPAPQDPARELSPVGSDATVDLPERFDENGRKKPEDPMADKLDEILAGKGAAGRLFSNFAQGIFGPEGRKKKG